MEALTLPPLSRNCVSYTINSWSSLSILTYSQRTGYQQQTAVQVVLEGVSSEASLTVEDSVEDLNMLDRITADNASLGTSALMHTFTLANHLQWIGKNKFRHYLLQPTHAK